MEENKEQYYSISQINAYTQCPKKYEYRYIKKIPASFQGGAMVFGSSTHVALQNNFEQKIFSRQDMSPRKVVDIFVDNMEKSKDTTEWETDFRKEIDTGKKLLTTYIDTNARPLMPRHVEKKFTITLPNTNRTFIGYIDLLCQNNLIIDYKTTSRKPSDFDIRKNSLQLSCYYYGVLCNAKELFPEKAAEAIIKAETFDTRLDFFVKTTPPLVIPKIVMRRREDINTFINIANSICDSIERGAFYPNFTSNLCNAKYCAYWELCHTEMSTHRD